VSIASRVLNFLKKNLDWLTFGVLLIFVVAQRWSSFVANSSIDGVRLTAVSLLDSNGTPYVFPPKDGGPVVAIAWNTWCVPCKVEMDRIEHAIKGGTVKSDRVFAINLGESMSDVVSHLTQNPYSFHILLDVQGEVATQLKATVTPTMYLIDANGIVTWASSGLGLTEIWRMERHLKEGVAF
jgi:cytochrome c biogenesis protein CcmG/thiol:disulfide interchange protein DsbE